MTSVHPSVTPEHLWCVTGTVVRGQGRGRHLGVPTANVDPDHQLGQLDDGVYAGTAVLLDEEPLTRPAAISVGTNPTFGGSRRTIEAHLLDFSGDLYGRRMELRYVQRVRGVTAFGSVVELLQATERDIAETRRLTRELMDPCRPCSTSITSPHGSCYSTLSP
jgi:riboflavin kinase/FMN adenylyltransferase